MAFIQRTGEKTVLRSEKLPVIAIQIDPAFRYAGSTSFILYDIAHAEQHHFVVPDSERRVLRRLWFQFEGYLADNNRTYNYSGMERLSLHGFTFLHDTYAYNLEQAFEERPTSDSAHATVFLQDKGYLLTGDPRYLEPYDAAVAGIAGRRVDAVVAGCGDHRDALARESLNRLHERVSENRLEHGVAE